MKQDSTHVGHNTHLISLTNHFTYFKNSVIISIRLNVNRASVKIVSFLLLFHYFSLIVEQWRTIWSVSCRVSIPLNQGSPNYGPRRQFIRPADTTSICLIKSMDCMVDSSRFPRCIVNWQWLKDWKNTWKKVFQAPTRIWTKVSGILGQCSYQLR